MKVYNRLDGKVALITGAATGIGRRIALAFAQEGASIIVNDVNYEAAENVAQEIRALGKGAISAKADVSNYEEVQQMVRKVMRESGRIDVLVNNAGIASSGLPVEDITPSWWEKLIGICLSGVFFCSQIVGREMIRLKRGKIINISSLSGFAAAPFAADYTAAKHGVIGITKALAVEWARYNINVNCICPGVTDGSMFHQYASKHPEQAAARISTIPLGKLASPEDHARAAIFLASEESDYVSGICICIDGGTMALLSGYKAPRREQLSPSSE